MAKIKYGRAKTNSGETFVYYRVTNGKFQRWSKVNRKWQVSSHWSSWDARANDNSVTPLEQVDARSIPREAR